MKDDLTKTEQVALHIFTSQLSSHHVMYDEIPAEELQALIENAYTTAYAFLDASHRFSRHYS